jgi:hypothetical protein
MNRRHKAAQLAQRASTQLHTLLFFHKKPMTERAYVMAIHVGLEPGAHSHSKIDVIVPRFGIEGSIYLEETFAALVSATNQIEFNFDSEKHILAVTRVDASKEKRSIMTLQVFDSIEVTISVLESDSGNKTLKLSLAESVLAHSLLGSPSEPATVVRKAASTDEDKDVPKSRHQQEIKGQQKRKAVDVPAGTLTEPAVVNDDACAADISNTGKVNSAAANKLSSKKRKVLRETKK